MMKNSIYHLLFTVGLFLGGYGQFCESNVKTYTYGLRGCAFSVSGSGSILVPYQAAEAVRALVLFRLQRCSEAYRSQPVVHQLRIGLPIIVVSTG